MKKCPLACVADESGEKRGEGRASVAGDCLSLVAVHFGVFKVGRYAKVGRKGNAVLCVILGCVFWYGPVYGLRFRSRDRSSFACNRRHLVASRLMVIWGRPGMRVGVRVSSPKKRISLSQPRGEVAMAPLRAPLRFGVVPSAAIAAIGGGVSVGLGQARPKLPRASRAARLPGKRRRLEASGNRGAREPTLAAGIR